MARLVRESLGRPGLGPFLLSLAPMPSQLRKMPGHEPAGGAVGMRPAPSGRTYCTVGGQQAWPWAGCPTNGWDGWRHFHV